MNYLYVTDASDGRTIDPKTITFNNGKIQEVIDNNDVLYPGTVVEVRTERDFIYVPDLGITLCEGDKIYLDNQSTQKWTLRNGWYEVDGNPAICGWYLESCPPGRVRSFYLKDLDSLTSASNRNMCCIVQHQQGGNCDACN